MLIDVQMYLAIGIVALANEVNHFPAHSCPRQQRHHIYFMTMSFLQQLFSIIIVTKVCIIDGRVSFIYSTVHCTAMTYTCVSSLSTTLKSQVQILANCLVQYKITTNTILRYYRPETKRSCSVVIIINMLMQNY